ncbi:hypothetical protein HMN09_00309600 [Mycena chlorophos]|uniref:Uncharacterized protein n=1 Tax=Mycena chlorophos TaxID=658473 RepID=A0A8H6THW6_MYCCL|nr:hypothetical protein HMN09_00309600 [Mycena chlorophos]
MSEPQSEFLFPGFAWLRPTAHLGELYATLWRDAQQPLSADEPPHLAKFISEFPPNEPSMDLDDDYGARAPIRYIDLEKHPLLAATHKVQAMRSAWREKAIFLVRDEYRELLKTALDSQATNLRQKANLLVTGQPGIGLSFACAYFILFLLASGQPFFFIGHRTTMYHFSEHGVQFGDPANRVIDTLGGREATTGLLHASWLLVDVEPTAGWGIPPAFINTKLALWTSSPGDGLRPYVKEFKAVHWYMQPWPGVETLSVARHYEIPDDECFELISAFGPIPRDIFLRRIPSESAVNSLVDLALHSYFVEFVKDLLSSGGSSSQAMHRVFLVSPVRSQDGSLIRDAFFVQFLSGRIAQIAAQRAASYIGPLQAQLTLALNQNTTRAVAGRLLEALVHEQLSSAELEWPNVISKTAPSVIEIRGKAHNFSLHPPIFQLPAYFRPSSLTFAAVDSILLTSEHVVLLQVSVGRTHSRDFTTMLQLVQRLTTLATPSDHDLTTIPVVLYALVGLETTAVRGLVKQAASSLSQLKGLPTNDWLATTGLPSSERLLLNKFKVVGYTYSYLTGFDSTV